MIEKGNFKWDLTGKKIVFSANGSVDGPATITSVPPDVSIDANSGVRLTVAADGQTVELQVDKDLTDVTITCTEPVDDPDTTDVSETISESVHFSASHSKATSIGVTVTDIARTEPA